MARRTGSDRGRRARPGRVDGTKSRTSAVVAGLVDRGLLDPRCAEEARDVVRSALAGGPPPQAPLRRRLSEVAGYVGGALVVAAATVFLAEEWDGLSTTGRIATLTSIAVVLFGAAVTVVLGGQRAVPGPGGDQGIRRRLASALGTGGAVAAAFALGVLVEELAEPFSGAPWTAGGLGLLVASFAGYRLAPSALGQVAMAAGAAGAVVAGLDTFSGPSNEVVVGLAVLGVGVVWSALSEAGLWWECQTGRVIGCLLLLFGAQFPTLGSDHETVGYVLTAALAVVAVVLYTRLRAVPYLVTAVAGLTIAVPEALLDWTDGSLGPVGALLATGVTLLVGSLLGLRLRHEVGEGPGGGPGAADPSV